MNRHAIEAEIARLSEDAERYAKRATYELNRPWDGWGESPASVAHWWSNRALSARAKARELQKHITAR